MNRISHTAIFEALNSRAVQGSSLMRWNAVSMGEWLLAFRGILMPSSSRMSDPRSWRHMPEAFATITCTVLPKWLTSPLWTLSSLLRATCVDGHIAASSSKIRVFSDEDCVRTGRVQGCGVIRACVSSDIATRVQYANDCLSDSLRALHHAVNPLRCAS